MISVTRIDASRNNRTENAFMQSANVGHALQRIKIRYRIHRRRPFAPPSLRRFQAKDPAEVERSSEIAPSSCANVSRSGQGTDTRHRQDARSFPRPPRQQPSSSFRSQWSRDPRTLAGVREIGLVTVGGQKSVSLLYQAVIAGIRFGCRLSAALHLTLRHPVPTPSLYTRVEHPRLHET